MQSDAVLTFDADFDFDAGDNDTVDFSFFTRRKVFAYGYELDFSNAEVDDHRFQDGQLPFLFDHDPTRIAGKVIRISTASNPMTARARFSKNPNHLADVQDIRDGVRTGISLGFAMRFRSVDGDKVDVATVTPVEISSVSTPQLPEVGVKFATNRSIKELMMTEPKTGVLTPDNPHGLSATMVGRIKNHARDNGVVQLGEDSIQDGATFTQYRDRFQIHEFASMVDLGDDAFVNMGAKAIRDGDTIDEFKSLVKNTQVHRSVSSFPPEIGLMGSGEDDELDGLLQSLDVGEFVREAWFGVTLGGAYAEVRSELKLNPGEFPVDLLFKTKTRGIGAGKYADFITFADAGTNLATAASEDQDPIVGQVRGLSDGEFFGVQRPLVGVGDASFPIITAGPTADYRSPTVAKDAEAVSISINSVGPVRLSAAILISNESFLKFENLGQALQDDLLAAALSELDTVALNGQAAVTNVSPAIKGIRDGLTAAVSATSTTTGKEYLRFALGGVDGKYARNVGEVRAMVHPEIFAAAMASESGGAGSPLVMDTRLADQFRSSSHMPAPDSSNHRAEIMRYAFGVGAPPYIQPIWRGGEFVREMILDDQTNAATGQTRLTVNLYTNGVLRDAAPYFRQQVQSQ